MLCFAIESPPCTEQVDISMHGTHQCKGVMAFMWSLQRTDMPTYLAQRLRASSDELSVQWCNGLVRALPNTSPVRA